MSLDAYRERVFSTASQRDGEATYIYNGSMDHAAIVIEAMFTQAQKNFVILTGNLNARVYGREEVVKQAKLFLSGSVKNVLRVVLEEDIPENRKQHPFFQALAEYDNFLVRYAPPKIQEKYDFHFSEMDGNSYRIEYDKKKPFAVAAFGDKEGAKNIANVFDSIWKKCEILD